MNNLEESEILLNNVFGKNKEEDEIKSEKEIINTLNSSKESIKVEEIKKNIDEYTVNKILISGASGYLGSYCVLHALNKGYKVIAQTRSVKVNDLRAIFKKFPNQEQNLEIVNCELTNHKEVKEMLIGVDCVINCAATYEEETQDEMSIIYPCIELTLTLLHKSVEVGVKRFIHVSTAETIYCGKYRGFYNETHWANPENCGINERAKIFSERSAWYFYEQNKDKIDFTCYNPALLVGKSIKGIKYGRSSKLFNFLMDDSITELMNVKIPLVNVNDVSELMINTILNKNTVGERFILCQGTYWVEDINDLLNKEFGRYSYEFDKKLISKFKIWILSFFDSSINSILPFYNKDFVLSEDKIQKLFRVVYRPIDETIGEMVHFLINENQINAKNNVISDYRRNTIYNNFYHFEYDCN